MQDRDELQKQVCDQLKQLSQLRSQLSDLMTSASGTTAGQSAVDVERLAGVEELRVRVDELTNTLEVRDKEVVCVFIF